MLNMWNPWHGCRKVSEGCENCYMYYLDCRRDLDGSKIFRTASGFDYPVHRDRSGRYIVRSGEMLHVCLTSDFFLEEADKWRDDAWDIIRSRPDVVFYLLTKRPQRVADCLPEGWREGFDNVFLSVTCENQKRADERIPYLLSLPFKHKGIMCAPFIGSVSIEKYFGDGQIERVLCGGENYDGARPCDFEWVKSLSCECRRHNVSFIFFETGSVFIKDGKLYRISSKALQSRMAAKSGMSYRGKETVFHLTDNLGLELKPDELYSPVFSKRCAECPSKPLCNGCSESCKSCTAR